MSKYKTIEEASKAAIKLGIKRAPEYNRRYKEDPKLPASPASQYKDDWEAFDKWYGYLEYAKPITKYKTIEEASRAAIKLGIKNSIEYKKRYKEDTKLMCNPDLVYKDDWNAFGAFAGFLGKVIKEPPYPTIEEASKATFKLGIKTSKEYIKRFKEDPKLRAKPDDVYKEDWDKFGKWNGLFRHEIKDFYPTIEEASEAAIKLGIKTLKEYNARYKEDPRLTAVPNQLYKDNWASFGLMTGFLGNEIKDFYPTIEEASEAAIKLGIASSSIYSERYKEDPRLPATPKEFYKEDWGKIGRWNGYLDKENKEPHYPTIEEASEAAIKLGITSSSIYSERYKEDPRLRSHPRLVYKDDWNAFGAFAGFLGKVIKEPPYPTIEEASQAVLKLGITTGKEYYKRYKEDTKLRCNPDLVYKDDWDAFGAMDGFLGKKIKEQPYPTIEEASKATIKLGIKTIKEYNKRYKEDPRLSIVPQNLYKNDWAIFGKWNAYFGATRTATYADIDKNHKGWLDIYDSYIKNTQRQLTSRKRTCIGFIVKFIKAYNYPNSPEQFLLKTTKIDNLEYESYLNYFGEKQKSTFHKIVLEFLDYCIEKLCTLDDDDERIIHSDYRNPLQTFQSELLEIKSDKLDESDKPVLAYTYVVSAREWIITPSAKSFNDLTHLQDIVESDWFDVDASLIDKNDPDCVYRYVEKDRREHKHTGKLIGAHNEKVYQIWSPVRFLALFTLLSVPARGQQILWCDSGEADDKVPELVNDKVKWCKNTTPLAGLTKNKGFIRKYPNDEVGLHITTNKTARGEGGYNIPWIPENLAYWMIKLRKWQSKYNSITEPTKWTDIKLKNPIGSKVLINRGCNCFLFRQPNDFNPYLTPILGKSLAYTLHQIERSDNPLTIKLNDKGKITSYTTEYTAHSMRVSLITAFIVDAKVPIHIVQKLVGHARLVMTIYYTKVGLAEMRDELNAADKRAMAAAPARIQQQIRNKNFEEIRDSLVPNDLLAFNKLNSDHPASAFSFTDIGICPMGGGRCEQGGEVEDDNVKFKKHLPVAAGHLGEKNCIRCRFFITSPAFLGGLTAVFNEISLKQVCIKQKENDLLIHIEKLDDERYDCEQSNSLFTNSMELEKAESNLVMVATETSMYATDSVYLARLVSQCTALLNESIKNDSTTENVLVANTTSTNIEWSIEETNSEFHQLSTVCENSTIYALSDASLANPRRAQLIDIMTKRNGMEPQMYLLSPEQQLAVGNQMSELLLNRFKSWENVEKLMNADLYLDDLKDGSQLTPLRDEVKNILLGSQTKLGINNPVLEEV